MKSLYHGMDSEAIVKAYPHWKRMVDHEMSRMADDTFRYRSYEDKWPNEAITDRLEAAFGEFLAKYHVAKTDRTSENALRADDAYEAFRLMNQKADWSFQNQEDPEGPDMPWGVRTVTNGYDNRYSMKSMEAIATAEVYGFVGFDQYGDRMYNGYTARPGDMSDDEAIEAAHAKMLDEMPMWELDESRIAYADAIVDDVPTRMRQPKAAVAAHAVPRP